MSESQPLPPPRTIAILGPGLLGGSVALAARARGIARAVHIWARRQEAIDQVEQLGIADLASTELGEVLEGADLVILATPVGVMAPLVTEIVRLCENRDRPLIITDLGSVKGSVVDAIDPILSSSGCGISFVGAHPMAGKERAGIEHATAELFEGAACVITPGSSSTPESLDMIGSFWGALGCRTLQMTPAAHDSAVAKISHLPHLTASLLTLAALADDQQIAGVAGAGFRDTTRVASGGAQMWTEILMENREAVLPAIRSLAERFSAAIDAIENGDTDSLHRVLDEAKILRDALPLPEDVD